MAATKLIAIHQNKGLTLEQTLGIRCDYIKNKDKTDEGRLVTSYSCNPDLVDEEFLLSKKEYQQNGCVEHEGDIIAYHIRQAFKPGEITPEEANRIGYETAMRFTKGNHAFIVATHTDKPHIHNHIVFNSTDLACKKKFRNFLFSGIALQRLSDIICLENGLSVIVPRKPSERMKRTFIKKDTFRDGVRLSIDKALSEKPRDFEELLRLLQSQGYAVKRGKHPAVKGKNGKRYIRFRSLGDGYEPDDIKKKIDAIWAGKNRPAPKKPQKEFDLLLCIQDIIAQGKGAGYELWAKKYNIKNLAKALIFFQENDIRTYEELKKRADDSGERFTELGSRIKAIEKRLDEISELKTHICNYAMTNDTYVAYRKSGYNKQFYEEHKKDIQLNKAAREAFDKFDGEAIPSAKALNAEFQELLSEKRKLYEEYHEAKEKMQLYKIAKYDIDRILGYETDLDLSRSSRRERDQIR
jgi:hypothetical protein